jgi:hypothetical protein
MTVLDEVRLSERSPVADRVRIGPFEVQISVRGSQLVPLASPTAGACCCCCCCGTRAK